MKTFLSAVTGGTLALACANVSAVVMSYEFIAMGRASGSVAPSFNRFFAINGRLTVDTDGADVTDPDYFIDLWTASPWGTGRMYDAVTEFHLEMGGFEYTADGGTVIVGNDSQQGDFLSFRVAAAGSGKVGSEGELTGDVLGTAVPESFELNLYGPNVPWGGDYSVPTAELTSADFSWNQWGLFLFTDPAVFQRSAVTAEIFSVTSSRVNPPEEPANDAVAVSAPSTLSLVGIAGLAAGVGRRRSSV